MMRQIFPIAFVHRCRPLVEAHSLICRAMRTEERLKAPKMAAAFLRFSC